jgi:hypothetical protein
MGEYAVMAELLAKPWVGNVYAPAADTGVDVLILTSEGKVRKVQVKTSRVYASGGFWWSVSKKHIKSDSTEADMFYVFAEDRPPQNFLVFPASRVLELFERKYSGTCQDRLIQFTGFGSKLQVRHSGPERRRERLAEARRLGESLDGHWNNWDLLK